MSEQVICWPTWMPAPQKNSYEYEPTDRTLESQMDIGTMRRVEFDTDETTISCKLVLLNRLQLEWFEKFERDCLRQGTKWFRMPLLLSGHVDWYMVQFQGRPKFGSLIGREYTTVTIKLRVEKRDLLDDDVMTMLTIFGPDALTTVRVRLNAVIGSTLPGVTAIPADLLEGI